MTVKSIIDLELDAAKFSRFLQEFNKFQTAASKLPAFGKQATKEFTAAQKAFDAMKTTLLGYPRVLHQASDETRTQLRQLQQSDRAWASIAGKTKTVAENIFTATRHLLGWSGLLGLGSGLLGAGSLFGIDRMARTAGDERKSAMGLGVSIGQQRAFQISFSRLGDPDSFLSWINSAEMDPTKRSTLTSGFTGNTASDAVTMMKRIRSLAQSTPKEMWGLLPQMYRMEGVSGEDIRRYGTMSTAEWNSQLDSYAQRSSKLDIQDQTAKKWKDLTDALDEAKSSIFATLVKGLAPLADPLKRLSGGVEHFVEVLLKSDLVRDAVKELADWLNKFSGHISAPKFLDDVKRFTSDVGDLADAVHAVTYAVSHPGAAAAKAGDNMSSWLGNKFMKVFRPDEYYKYAGADETASFLAGIDQQNNLPAGTMARLWQAESSSSYDGKTSAAGAVGPFQFMPRTAAAFGIDPKSFSSSASGGGYYLSELRKRYGGDLSAALAAYNGVGSKEGNDSIYRKFGSLDRAIKLHPGDWQTYLTPGEQKYISGIAGGSNVNITVHVSAPPGNKVDVAANQLAN